MKALIYQGSNKCALQDRPLPKLLLPTDAVVKMLHTTICGTDLHIVRGDVPTVEPGLVLGHEGIGSIEALGSTVSAEDLFVGDLVLISCITACGVCGPCRGGLPSHCASGGGWVLGNAIDGTQAEYVRIPHAACSLHKLPTNINTHAAICLSDTLPTGYECGTLNANVQPGSTVAIVGAGPVGLAAMLTAKLYSPSLTVVIDRDEARLELAKQLGADEVVNPASGDAMETLDALSGEHGFQSVIEAVGRPSTFELCQTLVAPGGFIANVGVHGQRAQLALDRLWDHNLTIRTRLVDTVTIPTLLRLYQAHKINPAPLVTHSFPFREIVNAYEALQKSSRGVLKVGIEF